METFHFLEVYMLVFSELANYKTKQNETKGEGFIYRCPVRCPIGRHCFIIKLTEALADSLTVLQKCEAKKDDIIIKIGGKNA